MMSSLQHQYSELFVFEPSFPQNGKHSRGCETVCAILCFGQWSGRLLQLRACKWKDYTPRGTVKGWGLTIVLRQA